MNGLRGLLPFLIAALLPVVALAAEKPAGTGTEERARRLAVGVEQLRHALGSWNVTTEFLNPDGTVARAARGTYTFDWIVPDRVLAGRSETPELARSSGILFYVREEEEVIEMMSVGGDGRLWTMTGPIDGEVRTTADRPMPDGTTLMLRFTRYSIARDRFESKMELSRDGGETWVPGNHQVFARIRGARGSERR